MIGDDLRGRARGRHGAQERHDWGRLARACARMRHGAQGRHDWGQLARARTRAGATVHKNAMIGDDSRGRTSGRDGAQECQKR